MQKSQHTEWKESWRDDYFRGVWVTFASAHAPVKTSVEILRLLAATPSTTLAEVAAETGKTPRAIEMAASKLVNEGRLKYVGPKKGGHWEVIL